MNKRNITILIILIAVLAFAVSALVFPLFGRDNLQLGLDLKGGVLLEYQVQFPEGTSEAQKATMLDEAKEIIRSRIDEFGVTEPIVQSIGGERISIQLPGFTDIEQAKSLVEETGYLEFREVELDSEGNPVTLDTYLKMEQPAFVNTNETGDRYFVTIGQNIPTAAILTTNSEGELTFVDIDGNPLDASTLQSAAASLYSWIAARGNNGVQLTGALLSKAEADVQTQTVGSQAVVKIAWNNEGTTIFDNIAARLYVRPDNSAQRCLGIFLDEKMISAPKILDNSYEGVAVIEGGFTMESAKQLANFLKSGSLPIPVQKPAIYEQVVSATLGANFINYSVEAGIVALILIIAFMLFYYRMSGLMAILALMFYGAVVLAIFKLVPVTLSLAGIGGFILSFGMAVDANILNFERMKEEIRLGKALGSAIDYGFRRAWLAIRDSNITTLIACVVLYWIGNTVIAGDAVKGFALTLAIGIIVSMFSALIVTRVLLNLFVGTKAGMHTSWFSTWSGRK
ncbi:MAG: protein translocase subunit SecD [Dehalococcoidales bacterium]|nr:protein translocase subunit SecD [Dehalococcoidales bacterium]